MLLDCIIGDTWGGAELGSRSEMHYVTTSGNNTKLHEPANSVVLRSSTQVTPWIIHYKHMHTSVHLLNQCEYPMQHYWVQISPKSLFNWASYRYRYTQLLGVSSVQTFRFVPSMRIRRHSHGSVIESECAIHPKHCCRGEMPFLKGT